MSWGTVTSALLPFAVEFLGPLHVDVRPARVPSSVFRPPKGPSEERSQPDEAWTCFDRSPNLFRFQPPGPESGHGCAWLFPGFVDPPCAEWVVDLPGHPEPVEELCQFSSHSDGRVLPARLAPFNDLLSPSPQVAIRSEGSEDVVCRLHEQPPAPLVPGLRDPASAFPTSGVILTGHESEVGSHVPTPLEAIRILRRQDEAERGLWPHAPHLPKEGGLGIQLLSESLNLLVKASDLVVDRLDLPDQRVRGRS